MANANETEQKPAEEQPNDGAQQSGAQRKDDGKQQPPPPPFAAHYAELKYRKFQVHFTDGRAVPVTGEDAYAIAKAINEDQVAYEILELDGNRTPKDGAILYLKHVTSIELLEGR
jgi:hypothetical protein